MQRTKATSAKLSAAKNAANDEFYTDYDFIDNEMDKFKKHFENKIIYLNCDDPTISNFYKFFKDKFKELKLKQLICSGLNLTTNLTYHYEYDREVEYKYDTINYSGKYDDPYSIELIKKADIVITNPPFSMFRDYYEFLKNYNKKFLILGINVAVQYAKIFDDIKNLRVSAIDTPSTKFLIPKPLQNRVIKYLNGQFYIDVNVNWFTNLEIESNKPFLNSPLTYHPTVYQKYDSYDAIECSSINNIPNDYYGLIGVPITFIYKWNPKQFELIDIARPKLNGRALFARVIIRKISE